MMSMLPFESVGQITTSHWAVVAIGAFLFVPPSALVNEFCARKLNREELERRIEHRSDTKHLDRFEQLLSADTATHINKEKKYFEVIAGYEPISSQFLCTIMFSLQEPESFGHLVKEIRATFKRYEDITSESLVSLTLLHASLIETLRSTVIGGGGLPRVSPGAMVDGNYIAKGVTVQYSHLTFTRSPRYFHEPRSLRHNAGYQKIIRIGNLLSRMMPERASFPLSKDLGLVPEWKILPDQKIVFEMDFNMHGMWEKPKFWTRMWQRVRGTVAFWNITLDLSQQLQRPLRIDGNMSDAEQQSKQVPLIGTRSVQLVSSDEQVENAQGIIGGVAQSDDPNASAAPILEPDGQMGVRWWKARSSASASASGGGKRKKEAGKQSRSLTNTNTTAHTTNTELPVGECRCCSAESEYSLYSTSGRCLHLFFSEAEPCWYLTTGNLSSSFFTPADMFWGQLGGALEALDSGTTTVIDHAHMNVSAKHSNHALAATLHPRVSSWGPKLTLSSDFLQPWHWSDISRLANLLAPNPRVSLGFEFDGYAFLSPDAIQSLFSTVRAAGMCLITSHSFRNPLLS
ncbi:hypothetical protein G7Y89_g2078 [Cudoniella acicularis]|uniref:Uncharacterized protein n=1 Tax=Cudoniella acicularis TaxID=354080 RepID=A0A8H4RWZ3_9HELO|nr:hypothetical protein G7Y89_g2078 [Cudoniella acicularis]